MHARILPIVALLALSIIKCSAFETETHALITRAAFDVSIFSNINNNPFYNAIELYRLDRNNPFFAYWENYNSEDTAYYSDGGLESYYGYLDPSSQKQAEGFEHCQMLELRYPQNIDLPLDYRRLFIDTISPTSNDTLLPIQNWLVRGAIREDDLGPLALAAARSVNCRAAFLEGIIDGSFGSETRVFNHFYDPSWDSALYPCPPFATCQKSVDWALGDLDSFVTRPQEDLGRRNHYSYRDARNAYWWALTREHSRENGQFYSAAQRELDAVDRTILWATTFRALGDVVHLIQDGAQPQHTRNDPHSSTNTDEQQAFEGYTNARILGSGTDRGGSYVRGFFGGAHALSPPPLGNYQAVMFSQPLRYFTTRTDNADFMARAGIADYSNRGFFTGGTLPGVPVDHPEDAPPPAFVNDSGMAINGYKIKSDGSCPGLIDADARLQSVTCTHYLHAVPDVVDPGYVDALPAGYSLPDVPVASDSVFRGVKYLDGVFPVADYVSEHSVSVDELDAMGDLAIPRAVGYSAGFLNFFFRGQIMLTSPPDGLYAVVDQGTPHHVSGDGVPQLDGSDGAFGFTTVRIRAKNTTMMDEDGNPTLIDAGTHAAVPQTMKGGQDANGVPTGYLVAIARYHRNPCYQTDLSGEYVVLPDPVTGEPGISTIPSNCTIAASRTAYQEIAVSRPIYLNSDGTLPGPPENGTNSCSNVGDMQDGVPDGDCQNSSALLEFDFADDAIPINATDLFLQVAYRGPLGDEEDGIAVGGIDIIEPNYVTLWNNTDWYYYHGVYTPPDQVPPLPYPESANPVAFPSAGICFGPQLIAALKPQQQLQPRQFMRFGLLTDTTTIDAAVYGYGNPDVESFRFEGLYQGSRRQALTEDSPTYQPEAIQWYGRGTTLGVAPFGVSYFSGSMTEGNPSTGFILQPAIGVPDVGVATQVDTQFTSMNDFHCYFTPDD